MTDKPKRRWWREPEPFVVDAGSLKAIADPLRLQIVIELSGRPMTVKEVADVLDSPPTRLYYHFKILEQAGIIHVAGRQMVRGIEERTYAAAETITTPTADEARDLVKGGLIGALLGAVRAQLEFAVLADEAAEVGEPDSTVPVLNFTKLWLSRDDAKELQRELRSLLREFQPRGKPEPDALEHHALFTVFQAPGELRDTHRGRRKGRDAPRDR